MPDAGPTDAEDRIYPCICCGVLRSRDEGGTVFTVCDDCWDRQYGRETEEATNGPQHT